jgi:hypothetical protein
MTDKRRQWERRLRRWRTSGLSSEAFGAKMGVTGRSVRRWDKKLREAQGPKGRRRQRLVRVTVVPTEAAVEQPVVVSVAGRRVEVVSGFAKSTLVAVLEVIERPR